ncbi:MAG: tetratricopeptide repeat protein [Caldilineaceae bacterium]|nr:tetratricopeptide repeat protein [Caldilineaceae bacterium]
MYLDRDYTPRRRKNRNWFWWIAILGFIGSYFYVRQPEWLANQPLQPTPTPTRSALSWQAEAEIQRESGNYAAALVAYKVAAQLEPENPDPLVAQAEIHMTDRRITQAYELAAQAVAINPEDVPALNVYARSLDWLGRYEEAINAAFDALDLEGENPTTLAILGEIYSDVGNWSRAQDYINQALAVDPQHVLALRNQAVLYELQGDYERAIDIFKQAIAIAADQPDLYIELGRQYQALNDWDNAIASYNAAVDVAPTAVTLDALGWGLYLSGDTLQAQRELRKAVEADGGNGSALAHLGMAYYARRNYEEAAPTLEKAIAILGDESRIEYYYSLGLAYIYKKPEECDKALIWFQKSLEIDPDTPAALEGLRLCQE